MSPNCFEIEPAVTGALRLQAEKMAAKGIAAHADLEAGLPPVLVSSDDLDLIMSNLVGNAVKYNKDGGSVEVRARHVGEWVRIDVKDTGIGIAEENLGLVLTEFFREKRPETRDVEGSGLGLSIVKRLVERAGGRLELASTQGEGSTFSVLLPA